MTKILNTWATAAVIVLVGSCAAKAADPPPASDVDRLQGRWETRAGASRELQVLLDVQGNRVEVVIQTPQGLKLRAKGELRLDETTTPRRVDWVKLTAGDLQTLPEIQGVYKLESDAFVLCTGGFNGARPSDFEAGDGPLADVVTFRRPAGPSVIDSGQSKP